MADIIISKLKFRRGTNDQRKVIIFDQGEPVYTTDTKRLYVGNGNLSGGMVIGSKIHPLLTQYASLTSTISEIGDIAFANNKYWQLTATDYTTLQSWADVSARLDSNYLNYNANNEITLTSGSISASFLNSNSVSGGLIISNGILTTDLNTNTFIISSNKLSIKAAGITEREIASSTLGIGLTGGSGAKLTLDIGPQFTYYGNKLALTAIPPFGFDKLSASWFGDGLDFNGAQQNVSLEYIGLSGTKQWSQLVIDNYGRVAQTQSSIYDTLQGDSALSGHNYLNSLSSIFNGSADIYTGTGPITKFTALSSSGQVITLSSAGFITFEGNTVTRTGQVVKRFAIPIFTY